MENRTLDRTANRRIHLEVGEDEFRREVDESPIGPTRGAKTKEASGSVYAVKCLLEHSSSIENTRWKRWTARSTNPRFAALARAPLAPGAPRFAASGRITRKARRVFGVCIRCLCKARHDFQLQATFPLKRAVFWGLN